MINQFAVNLYAFLVEQLFSISLYDRYMLIA